MMCYRLKKRDRFPLPAEDELPTFYIYIRPLRPVSSGQGFGWQETARDGWGWLGTFENGGGWPVMVRDCGGLRGTARAPRVMSHDVKNLFRDV